MRLKELSLRHYRNYTQADITFGDITLLLGNNAQGKTNVLEAVHLCCTGRSHRTRRDKELIHWDSQGCRVFLRVEGLGGERTLEMELFRDQPKQIRVNGLPIRRLGEMMGVVGGVLFAPEDLQLVKAGPGERRRYMDIALSQMNTDYFYSLQSYERVLRQRNALLRCDPGGGTMACTLPVWDERFIEEGVRVMEARGEFARRLAPVARDIHGHLSGGSETLSVRYAPDVRGEGELREAFARQLAKVREMEYRRGCCCCGPHRDDLVIEINGVDTRTYGSQGQQRTAALALKLSEIRLMEEEIGEKPILLLDDVLSELDMGRQSMLLDFVGGIQTVMTTTHLEGGIPLPDARIYHVRGGSLTPGDPG